MMLYRHNKAVSEAAVESLTGNGVMEMSVSGVDMAELPGIGIHYIASHGDALRH